MKLGQMAFLNRQSERISLQGGSKKIDWQLNARYIILGFHNSKENDKKKPCDI